MWKLLILVFVTSCVSVSQPEKWELPTGEKVVCMQYKQEACGLSLLKCGTVDFECLKEAKYSGPGDAHEPDIIDEKGPTQ